MLTTASVHDKQSYGEQIDMIIHAVYLNEAHLLTDTEWQIVNQFLVLDGLSCNEDLILDKSKQMFFRILLRRGKHIRLDKTNWSLTLEEKLELVERLACLSHPFVSLNGPDTIQDCLELMTKDECIKQAQAIGMHVHSADKVM